jgi:hypothetical protein
MKTKYLNFRATDKLVKLVDKYRNKEGRDRTKEVTIRLERVYEELENK